MSKFLKSAARRALNIYRPLDQKLRRNPTYQKLSSRGQKIYLEWVNSTPIKSAIAVYSEEYLSTKVDLELVLFDSFWGRKVGCNPYALYCAMREDPRFSTYKFIWVKQADKKAPDDVTSDPRVTFVEHSSPEYVRALLKAGVIVNNSNIQTYFSPKPEQYVVSTWHGIPMKTLGFDTKDSLHSAYNTQRMFNISDVITVSSERCGELIVGGYRAALAKGATKIIGSPRIDQTLKADVADIRTRLGIEPGKKVVLFAPTWRGRIGKVSTEVSDQVEVTNLIQEELGSEYHVLVSLHHLTLHSLKGKKLNFSQVPDDIAINEVMAVCDMVISDYSSIFIDYFVLDRPVILHVPDLETYQRERGLYMLPEELPVNISSSMHELRRALRSAKRPSEFETWQNVRNELLAAEDGNASARVLDDIAARVRVETPSDKRKVLISPGGLSPNGITSSFLNLTSNIDHDAFEVHVLVNSKLIAKEPSRLAMLSRLDPRCHMVLTDAPLNMSKDELRAYREFSLEGSPEDDDEIIKAAFEREYSRLLGRNRFDVAIDFSGYSHYWSRLISTSSSEKKIAYQHSAMLDEAKNNKRPVKDLPAVFKNYHRFDKIIAVSAEVATQNATDLANRYVMPEILSVPNVISYPDVLRKAEAPIAIASAKADALIRNEGIFCFVMVGRLSPEKGHELALRAYAKALDKRRSSAMIIVGTGPETARLKALADELRIADHVLFTGHLSNPYPVISGSDCVVFPSEYEGQGIALLEGMTLGKPCIASDIPVIRAILGSVGAQATSRTPEAFSAAMLDAMDGKISSYPFDFAKYDEAALRDFYLAIQ